MVEKIKPLSVVAVVSMNGGEAIVLNRPLEIVYEKTPSGDYIGEDGPFKNLLYYKRGSKSFKAFCGRELTLKMKDGTTEKIKDHWWHGLLNGTQSVVACDIESLKKCYVFNGGFSVNKEEYEAMRSTYTGVVYPYWDYEKVIKFDDVRKDLYKRLHHEEKRNSSLVKEVEEIHLKHSELEKDNETLRAMIREVEIQRDKFDSMLTESLQSLKETEQQRDALVAENVGLKVANKKLISEQQAAWPIGLLESFIAEHEPEIPATDAAIAEIGAKAIEQAAMGFHEKCYAAFEGSDEYGLYIRAELMQVANNLRGGGV
ncbi:hypothetical protein [Pectobacterium versatile]|uniref:hypothetical protein n=1 Tax=Pectobacterium versatile TaxID=2488639 RepID=UPI00102EC148|nr:hypothetical protein [Pectobacterium versatile]TAI99823.1 hypothetical protein EG332_04245 [Pectobacterium versatile]UEQ10475.1 hypothetical protein LLE50_05020 [Pectobacterium versatile]